ncbi:2-amino-4-hydroxy-6-hydroxymethyldihydropteridine diphosphokinase [Ramlibacter henchirensis]|uniref:2-amino-4-hydroxy-6-hydroxymethyldihydropteridine pyrophosphokinase n=1 Tax=Ramlibacter henchirensis TaxID=204072 RepID=A0A4Z0BWG4_9BURK|nr:2-amino-4-hydroxy-6-hydroxymethyldihydropteridine diphosphokinase [Ramlibacter henchirensis]TFZ02385.1 2-amino-4-hydroxy-6-hydroxymethyldihydropteridine diphosphokinase [Ramlibacter henchirensis]
MREPVTAYVALGANLGDAQQAVRAAMDRLDALAQTRVTARSSLYRTAPVGASGPDFINAVVRLQTALTAPDLLDGLLAAELDAGRERPFPNAPRTLDLDLLLYGDARIDSPRLTVPHPRMRERAFVLVPLAEIAPTAVPPNALAALTSQVIARIP